MSESTKRCVGTVQIQEPDGIRVQMTLSMSLYDWKRLASQLDSGNFPASEIQRQIQHLVAKAEAQIEQVTEFESYS